MNTNSKNNREQNTILTSLILLLFLLLFPVSADAVTDPAPESVRLETVSSSEDSITSPEIHLIIVNGPEFIRATDEISEELTAKDDSLNGVTLDIQVNIDNSVWKQYDPPANMYYNIKDNEFDLRLYNTGAIDLSAHTLYVKVRYAWCSSTGSVYYGSWSDVQVIGLNASDPEDAVLKERPEFKSVSFITTQEGFPRIDVTFSRIADETASYMTNPTGTLMLNIMISESGGPYRSIRFQPVSNIKTDQALSCSILNDSNTYKPGLLLMKARYEWYEGGTLYYGTKEPDAVSPWSEVKSTTVSLWSDASQWALPDLKTAEDLNLIPSVLTGKDFKQKITRAEFAALAVKLYEAITNRETDNPGDSPFDDCSDENVLKAYSVGIINGKDSHTFSPDSFITRQEAAVMLTRIYKAAVFDSWTLSRDDSFPLTYDALVRFNDADRISPYAVESVHFLASQGVINGLPGNVFAPKNTTPEEEASGYANTSRQQAIIMALRLYNLFAD